MQKWMWAVLIGGVATYFAHKYNKTFALVAGAATVVIAFMLWKNG